MKTRRGALRRRTVWVLVLALITSLLFPATMVTGEAGTGVHVHFLGGYSDKCALPDGTPITDTVYLEDASGQRLVEVPVSLQLVSGSVGNLVYESTYGTSIFATTDADGAVTFSVYSDTPGLSVVQLVYDSSPVPEGDTGEGLTDWVRSFDGCSAEFEAPSTATAGEPVGVVVYVYRADDTTPVDDGTTLRLETIGGYVYDDSSGSWGSQTEVSTTDNWVAVQVYGVTAGQLTIEAYQSLSSYYLFKLGTHSITINPGSPATAEISAPSTAPGDGTETSVSAVVYDDYGNEVADGTEINFEIDPPAGLTASSGTTSGGVVSTSVYSTELGTVTLAVYYGSSLLGSTSIEFVAGAPYRADVSASPETLTVGETSTVTAVVYDQADHEVADGTEVTFEVISGEATVDPLTASTSGGVVSTSVYSTVAGTVTLAVKHNTSTLGTVDITFDPGLPATAQVSASPTSVVADGSTKSTVTAVVRDVYGNRVPNVRVIFQVTTGTASLTHTSVYTDGSGQAQTQVYSSTQGTATITASVYDTGISNSVTVTFTAVPSGVGAVAPAPSPVTQTVPPSGGTVASSDGKLEVTVPGGVLSATGTVKILPVEASDEASVVARDVTGGQGALAAYKLEILVNGQAVTSFSQPLTLKVKVPYCQNVNLYRWDATLKAFVPLPGTCAEGVFSAQITHLTVFMALADGDPRFVDVPANHWAQGYIAQLARKRVVKGVGAYRFEPDRGVTRAEVAKMLVLAAGVPGRKGEDAGEMAGHWARDYVATARGARMVEGYPDGSFQPDRPVTRAELATMIARYLGLGEKGANFPDALGHWASGWIGALADKGVLQGYPDGSFRPDRTVTRAEAAKIIALALGWAAK